MFEQGTEILINFLFVSRQRRFIIELADCFLSLKCALISSGQYLRVIQRIHKKMELNEDPAQ